MKTPVESFLPSSISSGQVASVIKISLIKVFYAQCLYKKIKLGSFNSELLAREEEKLDSEKKLKS